MVLSDLSIRRPVICLVASIIIVLVGLLRFGVMPVREYPEIDSPTVSVSTSYPGASAQVVETKITEPLEKEVAAIEGIRVIRSTSSEQSSSISIEFNLNRNIEDAANDVRERVSRVRLPTEVDPPRVSKADPDGTPVFTMSFNSFQFGRLEITEMIDRIVVPRIQTIPGVGSVKIDGPAYAMRLWVDSDRLAAYGLTVTDVETALRRQNIDLPSGRIESVAREFPIRLIGNMNETVDFENLVLATRGDYHVKFADVGRVELGADDYRSDTFFKNKPSVGFQVLRQSQTNVLEMIQEIKKALPLIREQIPAGITIEISKDDSAYIERSVGKVFQTLYEAAILVVFMIFVFLRNFRATVIPLLAIPVSLIGSVAIIAAMGFSINILTLLAFVLGIGLVVDDAIVMLENIYRRVEEGEPVVHASIFGARQVAFAVIATTLTLAAVFVPVAFQSGQTGRLFFEFGITLAVSVLVSAFVALTLTPMLCSRLLKGHVAGQPAHGWIYRKTEPFFVWMNNVFAGMLRWALRFKYLVLVACAAFSVGGLYLYNGLQRELVPQEDRGIFNINMTPPVGSTPEFLKMYSLEAERLAMQIPETDRTFLRLSPTSSYVTGTLKLWEDRKRKTQDIMAELRKTLQKNITGVQASVATARPFGSSSGAKGSAAVQLVLQGPEFDELQTAGQKVLKEMRESGLFSQPRLDPSPTKPQLDVRVDRAKAADLRVNVSEVASTLETMLGSRRVTEFQRGNQRYYVMLQVEDAKRVTPNDLGRLYVKSANGHLVQLSNLVTWSENTVPENYPHFNRLRSITASGQLNEGVTVGDAVDFLKAKVKDILPAGYSYAWDGESRQYVEGSSDTSMLFGLALLFTFLILAAQFESWIHPLTIFTGVVLAVAGGIMVLYCTRFWGPPMTDNLFARFGLIMLIGLVAKNGILIVEFANQLQVEKGIDAATAAFEAATIRFRPILMTSVATVLGAVPIAFGGGAGAETRNPLGLVVVGGLTISTFLTLFVIPIVYILMDRLCVKLSGKSSAHGLKRAAEIEGQITQGEGDTAHGHGHGIHGGAIPAKT